MPGTTAKTVEVIPVWNENGSLKKGEQKSLRYTIKEPGRYIIEIVNNGNKYPVHIALSVTATSSDRQSIPFCNVSTQLSPHRVLRRAVIVHSIPPTTRVRVEMQSPSRGLMSRSKSKFGITVAKDKSISAAELSKLKNHDNTVSGEGSDGSDGSDWDPEEYQEPQKEIDESQMEEEQPVEDQEPDEEDHAEEDKDVKLDQKEKTNEQETENRKENDVEPSSVDSKENRTSSEPEPKSNIHNNETPSTPIQESSNSNHINNNDKNNNSLSKTSTIKTNNNNNNNNISTTSTKTTSSDNIVNDSPPSSFLTNSSSPLVLDNGSGFMKAGFAGDEYPKAVFPNVIGTERYEGVMSGVHYQHAYVGNQAMAKRGVLHLEYPVQNGIVTDWDAMEQLWQHTFDELRLDSNAVERPVLVTEAPLNPRHNRERMLEILFERFQVSGVYVAVQAVLGLYGSGRTTGVVLDSGDGVTHAVPVFEGFIMPRAVRRVDLAGRLLTEYLRDVLQRERGYSFTTSAELEIVRDIKEKHCRVLERDHATLPSERTPDTSYELPDGNIIHLGPELGQVPEALFDPSRIGKPEMLGIHDMIRESIQQCAIDIRKELFGNVILCGGNTQFPGLPERLQHELSYAVDKLVKVKVSNGGSDGSSSSSSSSHKHEHRNHNRYICWRGGSILASMPSFNERWVTAEEYDAYGPSVVHPKCF